MSHSEEAVTSEEHKGASVGDLEQTLSRRGSFLRHMGIHVRSLASGAKLRREGEVKRATQGPVGASGGGRRSRWHQ